MESTRPNLYPECADVLESSEFKFSQIELVGLSVFLVKSLEYASAASKYTQRTFKIILSHTDVKLKVKHWPGKQAIVFVTWTDSEIFWTFSIQCFHFSVQNYYLFSGIAKQKTVFHTHGEKNL